MVSGGDRSVHRLNLRLHPPCVACRKSPGFAGLSGSVPWSEIRGSILMTEAECAGGDMEPRFDPGTCISFISSITTELVGNPESPARLLTLAHCIHRCQISILQNCLKSLVEESFYCKGQDRRHELS